MIAVHCFYGCGQVERAVDPEEVHELMEQHYAARHVLGLERILAGFTPQAPRSGAARVVRVSQVPPGP